MRASRRAAAGRAGPSIHPYDYDDDDNDAWKHDYSVTLIFCLPACLPAFLGENKVKHGTHSSSIEKPPVTVVRSKPMCVSVCVSVVGSRRPLSLVESETQPTMMSGMPYLSPSLLGTLAPPPPYSGLQGTAVASPGQTRPLSPTHDSTNQSRATQLDPSRKRWDGTIHPSPRPRGWTMAMPLMWWTSLWPPKTFAPTKSPAVDIVWMSWIGADKGGRWFGSSVESLYWWNMEMALHCPPPTPLESSTLSAQCWLSSTGDFPKLLRNLPWPRASSLAPPIP
ncbi:predicted protein [Plenodomus lingam JN3]|uniref:Predicted protein n=1 Tax=Leptosphaeria maculans (strain JN3 / isolate v23.1.3 / race Av1-4-5-6-7-8) TaxID=985895 RepID=E5AAJ3_LEPMJ|nr:predicted protein [Plenodomus lingam JN3]CBY00684.1 predicted protein [Plenodomus lingam JN3]